MSEPSNPPRPPKVTAVAPTPPAAPTAELYWSEELRKKLGHVRTVGSKWFVYNATTGCWLESEPHIYRRKVMEMLPREKCTDRFAKSVVANLEGRMQCIDTTFCGAVKFESKDVVLINTRNCVLRVDSASITLYSHDPKFNFTCALNVAYDPEATCPKFDKCLVDCLPDEQDQMLLLNFFGYTLLPDTRFQLALICHGVSGSGKSTLVEPLVALYDHEALLTSFPIDSICTGKDYCLTHFQHAQVNICGELTSTEVTESANFKSIVAGDVLQSRGIYDKAARLRSICKLIFLANNPPRFRNGTPAEARRLAIIHFSKVPKEVDNSLRPALRLEVAGVFNLMLRRLQALLTMATIPQGGAHSRSVVDNFRLSNSPVESFVEQCCDLGADYTVPKADISKMFANFVYTHGLHEGLNKSFYRRLREKFAMIGDCKPGHVKRVPSFKGIKLKEGVADTLETCPAHLYDNLGI